MKHAQGSESLRLAELVAALSLGVDLGFGQPMEHVLRQCLIALRIAERMGQGEEERAVVYYTALLVNVGCHSDAHEQAKWFGDDIKLKSQKYGAEFGTVRAALSGLGLIGAGNPPLHRFRIGLEFVLWGHRDVDGMIASHSALAQDLAKRLGLRQETVRAVGAAYEHWDGTGWPGKLAGAAIPLASRIASLAEFIEVAHRTKGLPGAIEVARGRSGRQFDPKVAGLLVDQATEILDDLDGVRAWSGVIEGEPSLAVMLDGDAFDAALLAVADFVDLKSPYTLGHSGAVAALAEGAATALGLEPLTLRRAGLLHGLGRLGVSNSILDKQGPLGMGEWERVRMQPYFTDRMLKQSAALAPYAEIVAQHRERLDGSGYPRGLAGAAISMGGRVLAAADAYQAMREPRAHRPAHAPEQAHALLRGEVRSGRLDRDAVEAVLGAAGHRVGRRREGPAGLTAREVEVLQLLARGLSTKQIAERLFVSPKTAGNHIEHIYSKIGVTNRVAASLYAVQHGLLPEQA
jgi:HD-GYP domain-containing protein (c-di-GMP phosphodiesterase class II)